MSMYKEAAQQKLRFQTAKGLLTVEQLFDLSVTDLDALAVKLQEEYENSKGKSFLVKKTTKDKTTKLRFDIALDVLNTKVEEAEQQRSKQEDKEHNEKIYALIDKKKETEMQSLSVKDLEQMIRK